MRWTNPGEKIVNIAYAKKKCAKPFPARINHLTKKYALNREKNYGKKKKMKTHLERRSQMEYEAYVKFRMKRLNHCIHLISMSSSAISESGNTNFNTKPIRCCAGYSGRLR